MTSLRIRYKISLVVGLAVSIGLMALGHFYTVSQEAAVLAQNERMMRKMTESVSQGLQAVMLAGSADIAQSFAARLKRVPEIADFRILRIDGEEAFGDNDTIHDVNRRRGEELFSPRDTEVHVHVLTPDNPNLGRVLAAREPFAAYETAADGARMLNFYAPILNDRACHKCHGGARPVRGVIKLSTSLAPVEEDIARARGQSIIVIVTAMVVIIVATGYLMGHTVVYPIEQVTEAMSRVSAGDLDHKVPATSGDELGLMATSFNRMTSELKTTYEGLRKEQDKLATIIHGADEGIVVTDNAGKVVLVNPAAERLLGKSAARIAGDGFNNLFDDPSLIWRCDDIGEARMPVNVDYNGHTLQVMASVIRAADSHIVGAAAMLRDITEEKRLENELRRLSTTDALTGLHNRRHLDETMHMEFVRAQRAHVPFSVIMFDVDHFKRFNDTHGHDQGDRVLQAVASVARHVVREYDVPCRYGGEEFLVILPETGNGDAVAVAERLREDIEAMRVDGLRVTISLGVASFPDVHADTADQMIELADQALYRSKEAGRNRVSVAAPAAAG